VARSKTRAFLMKVSDIHVTLVGQRPGTHIATGLLLLVWHSSMIRYLCWSASLFLSHVSGATPPQLIVVHQLPGAFSLFFIYALLKKVAEEETPGRIVSTWHIAGASHSACYLHARCHGCGWHKRRHSPAKFNIFVALPLITTIWMRYIDFRIMKRCAPMCA
jgi:hypothetical protein